MSVSLPSTSAAGEAKVTLSDTSSSKVPESEVTMVVMTDGSEQNTEAEVACRAENYDGMPRLKLFFVSISVQTVLVWILADLSFACNLLSETFSGHYRFCPLYDQSVYYR